MRLGVGAYKYKGKVSWGCGGAVKIINKENSCYHTVNFDGLYDLTTEMPMRWLH